MSGYYTWKDDTASEVRVHDDEIFVNSEGARVPRDPEELQLFVEQLALAGGYEIVGTWTLERRPGE